MKKWSVVSVLLFLVAHLAWAVSEENWPSVEYEGKMLQLRWEPAGKNVKFFVTGYEAAAVKFSDMQLEVSYGIGENKKHYVLDRKSDHFQFSKKQDVDNVKLKIKIKGQDLGEQNVKLH